MPHDHRHHQPGLPHEILNLDLRDATGRRAEVYADVLDYAANFPDANLRQAKLRGTRCEHATTD